MLKIRAVRLSVRLIPWLVFPALVVTLTAIAFGGEYAGNTDVYVVPADAGDPKRLTWHPGVDPVQGWTPDIDVENWPKAVIAGKDPQLERAVDEAMKLLKSQPPNRLTTEPPSPEWGKRKGGS